VLFRSTGASGPWKEGAATDGRGVLETAMGVPGLDGMEEGFRGFEKLGLMILFLDSARFTCPLDGPPFENGPAERSCPETIQNSGTRAASMDAGDEVNRDLSRSLFRNFIVLDPLNLRHGILTANFGENQSKVYG